MKNELKKLIEKIKYNKEEETTDKIIGIYNVSCDYLKKYKNKFTTLKSWFQKSSLTQKAENEPSPSFQQ